MWYIHYLIHTPLLQWTRSYPLPICGTSTTLCTRPSYNELVANLFLIYIPTSYVYAKPRGHHQHDTSLILVNYINVCNIITNKELLIGWPLWSVLNTTITQYTSLPFIFYHYHLTPSLRRPSFLISVNISCDEPTINFGPLLLQTYCHI